MGAGRDEKGLINEFKLKFCVLPYSRSIAVGNCSVHLKSLQECIRRFFSP